MNLLKNEPYRDAAPGVLAAIQHFRRYILQQRRERAEHWPACRVLIQRIASEINAATEAAASAPVMLRPATSMLKVRIALRPARSSGQVGELRPVEGGFEAAVYGRATQEILERERETLWGSEAATLTSKESGLTAGGRLTLAHEIGHVFFYTSDAPHAIPSRLYPLGAVSSDAYKREEALCTDFARALLIDDGYAAATPATPSILGLMKVARRHRVPAEVALHRVLYDWELWPDCMFARITVRDVIRAKVFRGGARRNRTKSSPTRTQIERALVHCVTADDICRWLRVTYRCTECYILPHLCVVWCVLE